MNARKKALQMLKTAKAERREALDANNSAAADALLKDVIKPLKRQIAGGTLGDLQAEAQALNALSDILETALAKLNGRIDRFFLDDLTAKARDLALVADDATARANPRTPPPSVSTSSPVPTAPATIAPPAPAAVGPATEAPPTSPAQYAAAFERMTMRPEWGEQITTEARLFLRNDAERRYRSVSAETGVPWWVIGLLHKMEASQSFRKHLHNGDPLTAPTVQRPENRPPGWQAGMSWEESAVDALKFDGLTQVTDWSLGALLERAERWNGLGYRNRGHWSPFVWAGCSFYERGKFVRDGVFDAETVSAQVGIAPLIRRLIDDGVLEFGGDVGNGVAAPVAVNPASALDTPRRMGLNLDAFPHASDELDFPRQPGQTVEQGMGIGRRATSANNMAVRRVQEWCILHNFVTSADGVFGSATKTTVEAFQRQHHLPATGAVDEETWALLSQPMHDALAPSHSPEDGLPPPLAQLVIDVANAHLVESPSEAGGNNSGPWVRLYMDGGDGGIGGNDKTHLWCAGFVCFIIAHACRDLGVPMPVKRQTLVANLVRDAKADGRFVNGDDLGEGAARAMQVPVGGLFVRRGGRNGWDHTGIVVSASPYSFGTIEGNTTGGASEGGRDGGIVKRSTRAYGKYDYIRLT